MTISPSDIEPKKRYGRKKPYISYANAISEYVPWLKEQISKSKDGFINIREIDMLNILGEEFKNKHFVTILSSLKFVLFAEGIIVREKTHKDGSKLFLMRFGNEDDVLPRSLAKHMTFDD